MNSNVDLPSTFKYEVFPMGRNNILLRLEHIGDKFDTDYRSLTIDDTSIKIDVEDWAIKFFNAANKNPVKL